MSTGALRSVSCLCLVVLDLTQENICITKACRVRLSTTFEDLSADKIIDGNINQDFRNCSHTAHNQHSAFVELNLGKVYQLKNIVIYYRTEDNWKPYRLRQYRLEVSNSTGSQEWIQCFKDNTLFPAVPSSIQNSSCEKTARYISISTTYDAPEDDPIAGPILELCEIQVYAVTCSPNCVDMQCDEKENCIRGCNSGFWGNKCQNNCSSTCSLEFCNMTSGLCNSCTSCPFCNMSCSENCANANCNQYGTCIGGCKPNWRGNECKECDSNHYGPNCSNKCSVNCIREICDNVTGSCTFGCKRGFYLQNCEKRCSTSYLSACNITSGECEGECPVDKYGSQCDKTCDKNCKNGCSRISGLCDSGCIDGKFGIDCLKNCSIGCISGCHQANGKCICKTGWQGQNCDECNQNRYGPGCDQHCSPICLNGTCFSSNGSCKEGCNINFNYGKVIQRSSENESNGEDYSAQYVVIPILFISIFLNIFLIVRNIRHIHYERKNSEIIISQQSSTIDENISTYNRLEDIPDYQELGQLRQPSQYDELK